VREHVAGIDEAGRGPLAGPVVVAAVILNPARRIRGLADSKQLNREERERLAPRIRERALAFAIIAVDACDIDRINILQATLMGMTRAAMSLSVIPSRVLIDGNQIPKDMGFPARAIVKGDATEPCISAASILAKTFRDALMTDWDAHYPGYGFAQHFGYPTPAHLERLKALGPCPLHRRSFGPVRECMQTGLW
jgi:ribonuclease HII